MLQSCRITQKKVLDRFYQRLTTILLYRQNFCNTWARGVGTNIMIHGCGLFKLTNGFLIVPKESIEVSNVVTAFNVEIDKVVDINISAIILAANRNPIRPKSN